MGYEVWDSKGYIEPFLRYTPEGSEKYVNVFTYAKDIPLEDLPKYINDRNQFLRHIVLKRLKGDLDGR